MDNVSRIAILPSHVVNQIAAGEVVERPASVVKELVENALDAGASRIDVAIEQGGRQLVRVADDGCGMTPEEAELALKRHATSKLRAATDLLQLRTMGFRGEALPSIASVSRLSLVTRPAGRPAGYCLQVEQDGTPCGEPHASRVGTTIEVRDLFHNTPVRLKFLKSTATETGHVTDLMQQLALANPGVHLTLTVDGRLGLDLPRSRGWSGRTRAVLGRRGRTLAHHRHQASDLEVEAALAPPAQATRSGRSVMLLVNGRVVRDRALLHAVVAGYADQLEPGRFPLAVVRLDVDPSQVDVNVHPQKTEVRFAEPERVFDAVRRCVWDGLAAGLPRAGELGAGVAPNEQHPAAGRSTEPTVYRVASNGGASGYGEQRQRLQEASRRFWAGRALEPEPQEPEPAAPQLGGDFSRLRPVGRVLGDYLLCEGPEELVLVDERAARAHLIYQQLCRAMEQRGHLPTQPLLIPVELQLEPRLQRAAGAAAAAVQRLGLELEPFGAEAWVVRAVPSPVAGADTVALVREVLELAADGAGLELDQPAQRERVLAALARHEPAQPQADLDEADELLRALDRIDMAAGRPPGPGISCRISRAQLARMMEQR